MRKHWPSDIWVVIPGYNEQKYIDTVLTKTKKHTVNIVFVDDGSHDNTAAVAMRHIKHVLVHPINLGKGAAMKTGCEYVFNVLGGKAVIFMDADDQHNPADLLLFINNFTKKYQVIFGVRKLNKRMPLMRRAANASYSVLIWLLFGDYIADIPSGFKAFTKQAYQRIRWNTTDYAVETEIAARVAKEKLPHKGVIIETIYHDLDRGMTVLDVLKLITQIISWKFNL
jgi:glycosyltransferase involved in cell wall biosynthesis